ncbi:cystathionine gamma-lyase [Trichonephila inaurata madagascariensis]|uniref:cystathionine gamma-lyase n=1 Tax=Trichonephila inaurata madagascariensis TaxID=2747483 RepID=A0A8X7CIV8_9ARAC|nr:cystathionine gamma-lyase [Trichonephila inaurata madagascariensis]
MITSYFIHDKQNEEQVYLSLKNIVSFSEGHSDVLMGAAVTNREDLYKKLKETSKSIGSLPSPMDCFLCLRGLKTLHLRMERHSENGLKVAKFLEKHPKVEKVFYPGGLEEAKKLAARIKIFTLAVSLGGGESLMDVTAAMTASPLNKEEREMLEITDNLIRLSIGLEDARDLIADLDQALSGV